MRIVHRYFVRGYLWPLFFTTLIFLLMFVFVDSLNNLDEFLRQDAPLRLIFSYYAALIPIITAQIMPAAVLFSALYFLSHLNKYNEITALKAGGVSGVTILWPIYLVGLIISVGVLAMNETVTPQAAITSTAIKRGLAQTGSDRASQKTISNVTLLSGNHLVYARELAIDTGTLYGVIVMRHRNDLTVESKVTAARGVFNGTNWVLFDVVAYYLDATGDMHGKPENHERMDLHVDVSPAEFVRQGTETHFMSYRQLKDYIQNSRIGGERASNRLLVDLHQKLAAPFACIIILLAGTPLALKARRGGAFLSLGGGLALVGVYYVAIAIFLALGKGGVMPATLAVWLPHAAFAIFGLRLLLRY